jgi:hypothetical protein
VGASSRRTPQAAARDAGANDSRRCRCHASPDGDEHMAFLDEYVDILAPTQGVPRRASGWRQGSCWPSTTTGTCTGATPSEASDACTCSLCGPSTPSETSPRAAVRQDRENGDRCPADLLVFARHDHRGGKDTYRAGRARRSAAPVHRHHRTAGRLFGHGVRGDQVLIATLRHRMIRVPARLVRHAGALDLRLPPGHHLLEEVLADDEPCQHRLDQANRPRTPGKRAHPRRSRALSLPGTRESHPKRSPPAKRSTRGVLAKSGLGARRRTESIGPARCRRRPRRVRPAGRAGSAARPGRPYGCPSCS